MAQPSFVRLTFILLSCAFIGISFTVDSTQADCIPKSKLDVLFMLDSSSSVRQSNWFLSIYYIIDFISKTDISENALRFAVITYSQNAVLSIPFDSYNTKLDFINKLYQLVFTGGKTDTVKGLKLARDVLLNSQYATREGVNKALVILTDGAEEGVAAVSDLADVTKEIQDSGVQIIGIGMGVSAKEELEVVVNVPTVWHMLQFNDYYDLLNDGGNAIYNVLCGHVWSYQGDGCYIDVYVKRGLPELLFTDRDNKSSKTSRHTIDWENWGEYMPKLINRCFKAAIKHKYKYFGIQFYGECWAGYTNATYRTLGGSYGCVNQSWKNCQRKDKFCAGRENSNYVYQVVDRNVWV